MVIFLRVLARRQRNHLLTTSLAVTASIRFLHVKFHFDFFNFVVRSAQAFSASCGPSLHRRRVSIFGVACQWSGWRIWWRLDVPFLTLLATSGSSLNIFHTFLISHCYSVYCQWAACSYAIKRRHAIPHALPSRQYRCILIQRNGLQKSYAL